ncbi:hypothetical protein DV735_g5592, partial [Chaetothyriales sp. CBS 134920]
MSAQVAPAIPPRPVKGTKSSDKGAGQAASQPVHIPLRPASKRLDRSVSPGSFPRSPLNEPFNPLPLTAAAPKERTSHDLPRKLSVQQLPSVGQEGLEYSEVHLEPEPQSVSGLAPGADDAAQTRSVAHDLQLHAPRPSLPKAAATAQVQAVTRTDASNAAALGIGKPDTPVIDDVHDRELLSRNRSRASFSRPDSSASTGRRTSVVYGDEQGPAELGLRVPINPLLGDVQAPSPAPFLPSHTGHSADGQSRHGRKKSVQHAHPPGSYGLHGHGVQPHSPFDRDWYAKHPEELAHEEAHGHGVYEGIGSGRGSFALSSDDLNRIVHSTAVHGAGVGMLPRKLRLSQTYTLAGAAPTPQSYPDVESGYEATVEYASRSNSTAPAMGRSLTNGSLPAVESPLRNSNIPVEAMDPIVHVKHHGSLSADEEAGKAVETRVAEESHALDEDHDYRAPILAADEVAKLPHPDSLQPAIHPRYERRSNSADIEHRSGDNTPNSRPSSRPSSIYGLHSASHTLSRFVSHHDDRESLHTPLEDVDEYEPLFADDDGKQNPLNPTERFKPRPELAKHRFPSQDIWEEAPSSVNHTATVSTPDLAQLPEEKPSVAFETPEAEAARRAAPVEEEKSKLELAQEQVARRFVNQPRFPSRDIWEDSPDSQHLVAIVQSEPSQDEPVEPTTKPAVPPRPTAKSKPDEGVSTAQAPPSIPPRPAKKNYSVPPLDAKLTDPKSFSKEISPTDLKRVPSIPDRPKPQIPPRPAKKVVDDGLSRTLSSESANSQTTEKAAPVTSPSLAKVKPQIPARPAAGAKFASLKGNFINDLNQKLGLGPRKEKEPEPEAEAKPLEDARKGRARGPQRRAPVKSPAAAPAAPVAPALSLSHPQSLWSIDLTGLLSHHSADESAKVPKWLGDEDSVVPDSTEAEVVDHGSVAKAEPGSTAEEGSKAEPEDETSHKPSLVPAGGAAVSTPENSTSTEAEGSSSSPGAREDADAPIAATVISKQVTASSGSGLETEPSHEEEQAGSASTSAAILSKDE